MCTGDTCINVGKGEIQKKLLEKELEAVGIRLNKRRPNIYFKVHTYIHAYVHVHTYIHTCTYIQSNNVM